MKKRNTKKVLQSKFFKELYSHYFDADKKIDYLFDENANIDYILSRIKLLPYRERDNGKLAWTIKKKLKIIVSSYYISNIGSEKDFITYKILEMARKIILFGKNKFQF